MMRRNICFLFAVIFMLSFLFPFYTGAVDAPGEYIETEKSTYLVGEFLNIRYRFEEADDTRWICFYKDGVAAQNMLYAMHAPVVLAANYFAPVYLKEIGGDENANPADLLQTGMYVMKVMYLTEGGDCTDAQSFAEGEKSTLTSTFAVQSNQELKPTISVEDREIPAGDALAVQFKGIANTLGTDTLQIEIRDTQNNTVKSRFLWSGQYYAGLSGTMTIPTDGLEPGTYAVQLICSNPDFDYDGTAVEITLTEAGTDTDQEKQSYFPEDLFSSAERCGQFFVNADNPKIVYEEVDGEWVMHVPVHPGYDYLYTWEPIPYTHYTVTFDFCLNLFNESGMGDELDFLFGLSDKAVPFHQIALVNNNGILDLLHYQHTGEKFYYYEGDTTFWDVYEEDLWGTLQVEVTPDDVSVYYDGMLLAILEDTQGCVGEKGGIGIRGGSEGGWMIKNLVLVEGVSQEPVPENTPTVQPTQTPESHTAQSTPEQISNNRTASWIWIMPVSLIVLAGGIGTFIFFRKRK